MLYEVITHFNEPEKRDFIKQLLLDSIKQNAIPIVNYNDSVSNAETRKMELINMRQHQRKVVECIDNDETASEIATLVKAKYLVILTSAVGLRITSYNVCYTKLLRMYIGSMKAFNTQDSILYRWK